MGEKIESETQSLKRLQYLDLAKAVGMLCVLIGHSFISEKINTVIYAFHMPLFFFISGYLCKPQKSLRKESKVVQTKKQYGDFSLTALSFASISIFSG